MTRVHADEVDVERGVPGPGPGSDFPAEGPARFRWQSRPYDVQAVLEHWVEAGNWWQCAVGSGSTGVMAGVSTEVVLGIDDGEREVWRVEAASRYGPVGVYDLRFEWGTGRWSLIRVHD